MATTIFAGLTVGAIYALTALGYNIVFVASGTFNFAQAQFVMLGTLLAFTASSSYHWPLPAVIVFAAAVGGLAGAAEHLVAIRTVAGRGIHGELVTTVGASVVIEGVALIVWGINPHAVKPFVSDRTLSLLSGRVNVDELVLVGAAVLIVGAVAVLSRRTILGLASLATSEDRDAALLRGINVRALSIGAVVVAAGLGTALGPLIGTKTFAVTSIGDSLVLKAFLVLAIGGFGSFEGVLLGGMVVGLTEALIARYLGGQYLNIGLFILLMGTLLMRPQGLFGRRVERTV